MRRFDEAVPLSRFVVGPESAIRRAPWPEDDRRMEAAWAICAAATEILLSDSPFGYRRLTPETRVTFDAVGAPISLRSAPLEHWGGGEFRHDLPKGKLEVWREVDGLAANIRWFLASREEIASTVHAARREMDAAVAGSDVEVVAVGIRVADRTSAGFDVEGDLRTLGHCLTPITRTIRVGLPQSSNGQLAQVVDDQRRRAALVEDIRERGHRGWVDATVLRLLERIGVDLQSTVEAMDGLEFMWLNCQFGGSYYTLKLHWQEGLLKTDFSNLTTMLCFEDDVVEPRGALSEKTLSQRVGHRIGRLVKDPLLPEDAIVSSYVRERNPSVTRLRIMVPRTPIPMIGRQATRPPDDLVHADGGAPSETV